MINQRDFKRISSTEKALCNIAILIPEKSNNGREPSIVSVGDIETSTKASLSFCPFCTKYILGITDMAINSKIPAPIPKIRVLLCFLV